MLSLRKTEMVLLFPGKENDKKNKKDQLWGRNRNSVLYRLSWGHTGGSVH